MLSQDTFKICFKQTLRCNFLHIHSSLDAYSVQENKVMFFEVSAYTGKNVTEALTHLARWEYLCICTLPCHHTPAIITEVIVLPSVYILLYLCLIRTLMEQEDSVRDTTVILSFQSMKKKACCKWRLIDRPKKKNKKKFTHILSLSLLNHLWTLSLYSLKVLLNWR